MIISYANLDNTVEKLRSRGHFISIDGWDIQLFRPDPGAQFSKHGSWKWNRWGFTSTISPNSEGEWSIRSQLLNECI